MGHWRTLAYLWAGHVQLCGALPDYSDFISATEALALMCLEQRSMHFLPLSRLNESHKLGTLSPEHVKKIKLGDRSHHDAA